MSIASAICTALIGVGLFSSRRGRGRRWLFVSAGVLCSAMTAWTIIVVQVGYAAIEGEQNSIFQLAIVAALLLSAVALLGFGWKGPRVGDHPYCRHCGFDLFGKPAESTRCNECGTDLATPGASVIGVRQVRRWPVLAGVFLLLLSLMLGGEAARELKTHGDWYSLLPTWWYLRDFDSPTRHLRASMMLTQELMSATPSHADIQLIAERVLRDREAGRPDQFSSLLGQLLGNPSLLDEPTTRRLMRALVDPRYSFATPSTVYRGQSFALQISRLGWWSPWSLRCESQGIAIKVDETVVSAGDFRTVAALGGNISIDLRDDWSKIPRGSATVSVDAAFNVVLQYGDKRLIEPIKTTQQRVVKVVDFPAPPQRFPPPS
jgi:hypothetical protein